MSEEENLTPWQKYKRNLGSTRPWDLLNPNTVRSEDELQKSRMDICNSCPELISITKQCKQCGCIMPLKTRLAEATCPLGKW